MLVYSSALNPGDGLSGGGLYRYIAIAAFSLAALGSLARVLTPAVKGKLGGFNPASITGIVIFCLFLISGAVVIWNYYGSIGESPTQKDLFVTQVIFALHLFFGMLVGMVAKYFHELTKAGKTFADAKLTDLFVPFTVSFIVFFGIWGAVAGKPIGFISVGLAIQNGFFWQDVLGRAGPPHSPGPAPGGGTPLGGKSRRTVLRGDIGSSAKWDSAWIELASPKDLKKGDRLILTLEALGNVRRRLAEKVLVRLLRKGDDPNSAAGVIDPTGTPVPENREIEVTVPYDVPAVTQISVHGGENPWNRFPLGEGNGPATLTRAELMRGSG